MRGVRLGDAGTWLGLHSYVEAELGFESREHVSGAAAGHSASPALVICGAGPGSLCSNLLSVKVRGCLGPEGGGLHAQADEVTP